MPTLEDYLLNLGDRLGGMETGTVDMDPDTSDSAAQRKIISARLFDLDKQASIHQYKHVWIPRYENWRMVKKNGYGRLAKSRLTAPSSTEAPSGYTLTVWGFGTATIPAYNSNAATIQGLLTAIAGLEGATVTGTYPEFIVDLVSEEYTLEASVGTVESGFGFIEMARPFTKALTQGTTWLMQALLPFENQENFTGLIPAINNALARMTFVDRIPFTVSEDGQQTFELTDYPWLETQDQALALFAPTQWQLSVPFTPPGSSTYTLTVTSHEAMGTTSALAYTATADQIQTALRAIPGCETAEVTGTGTFTITISKFWYYNPTLTASSGTVGTSTITREYPLRRSVSPWRIVLEGQKRFLELDYSFSIGHTIFLEVERPGDSKLCRQTDWQTPGTTWINGYKLKLAGWQDQANLGADEVGAVAFWLAAKAMAQRGPQAERQYWATVEQKAGEAAAGIKLRDLPEDQNPKAGVGNAGTGAWGTKSWGGW